MNARQARTMKEVIGNTLPFGSVNSNNLQVGNIISSKVVSILHVLDVNIFPVFSRLRDDCKNVSFCGT